MQYTQATGQLHLERKREWIVLHDKVKNEYIKPHWIRNPHEKLQMTGCTTKCYKCSKHAWQGVDCCNINDTENLSPMTLDLSSGLVDLSPGRLDLPPERLDLPPETLNLLHTRNPPTEACQLRRREKTRVIGAFFGRWDLTWESRNLWRGWILR